MAIRRPIGPASAITFTRATWQQPTSPRSIHLMAGGGSNAFDAGTGQGNTVMEALRVVEEVTQKRVPYTIALRREGYPASLVADAAKLRRELGWEPKRSVLRDIVHDAWAFYQLKFTH